MELDELENHVVICGWNDVAQRILDELLHDDRFANFVIVSDQPDVPEHELVQQNRGFVFTLQQDFTRLPALEEAGIERAQYAIVLADPGCNQERNPQDRDARSVLTAMLIEKASPGIHTTVQLLNEDNEASLRNIGVEEIIISEDYIGNIMASVTKNEGLIQVFDELLTTKFGHEFFRSPVPDEFVGMTVQEVLPKLKGDHDAILLAVGEGGEEGPTKVNPPKDFELEKGHFLYTAGPRPLLGE